ncbi:AraC family transcriptional regulator [Flavobacteriaceae bacterium XHP0103]|uniref:AraC family transcriptional regulator n=1 Tax=Marixanthotalea marina TaxID=2844359 RepID=UPI002989A27B|nr:AraC family transcriptional regulator [Marixanthotalea marina]MBU3820997.1 AraC family transcriptional regulator [Marixanthotalea marina]
MKLHFLDRSCLGNTSFSTKVNEMPFFLKIWHYHPELELVLVLESEGTRFIGDNIEKFEPGEVILIGENLPHMWLNDEAYFKENSKLLARGISVHFKKNYLGTTFFSTPEMSHLLELFNRARFGIKFLGVDEEMIQEIQEMAKLEGFEKSVKFLMILDKLANHKDYRYLASQGYVNSFKINENETLDKVYAYIFKNFNKSITLQNVADVAHMNTSAFSRFFKRVNSKTFSQYISEIRIGYACKLLIERKYNIAEICYESGFNNISNFNRKFKLIMKCTPSVYVKKHLE